MTECKFYLFNKQVEAIRVTYSKSPFSMVVKLLTLKTKIFPDVGNTF